MNHDEYFDEKVKEVKSKFAKQIKYVLKDINMSQRKLSKKCGLHPQDFYIILNDMKRNITIRSLCRIADALGCRIDIKLKKVEDI